MAVPTKDRGAEGPSPPLAPPAARRRGLTRPPYWWAAVLVAGWLLYVAADVLLKPRADVLDAVPGTVRVLLAALVVFGVTGLGVTQLLLPASLRRHGALWVLPVGACVTGLSLMALGFAAVPFPVSLVLVLAAGAWLSVRAVRSHGWPSTESFWPAFLALGVFTICVTPMVTQLHMVGVTGTGSDAHVAAGAANFLMHAYPTSTDASLPVDRMPLLWKSKFPIYYAYGAVSAVSGLETWQVLTPLIGVLLGIAAIGMFLVARQLFSAPLGIALLAMGFVGFDRMVLHTGLNPYFNQTWGYLAMPFTLVLAWWLVRPGESRGDRKGTAALLAIFLAVVAFAYPLAAPIAGLPLMIFLWRERKRRKAEGRRMPRVRDLYRGPRSLLWMVPLGAVLLVPVIGVAEKVNSSSRLATDPTISLAGWAGDLRAFIPMNHFFNLPDERVFAIVVCAIVVLAFAELRRAPREVYIGLGVLFAVSILEAIGFRNRDFGYYFHFKILAFIAPLLIVVATVGVGRLRRVGPPLLALFAVATAFAARDEVRATGLQVGTAVAELGEWADVVPENGSVRLDMPGGDQLWGNYFMASRRTCSTHPLYSADYPRVAFSRKADFALVRTGTPVPAEAVGAPVRSNDLYALYRLDPAMAGADTCSRSQESRISQDLLGGD